MLNVPLWQKITLSFHEAAQLTGVGENRLRALADRKPELTVTIDSKKRLKRKKLEDFLMNVRSLKLFKLLLLFNGKVV